ncbi:HAD family phosphatase [Ornithinimicrobium pratense]|uniref:HAD family phosphatase n=2 Tax=Ornithinimicrobium pratense TaxID=2593973 RepID=A0A5J6V819_9MICO|nr:HAD family phosphatase [Ornithinimicrobium pratense]
MDGTLVDTEPYWIAEEYALVEAAGGVWTEEDAHDLVGQDLRVSARMILDRTPVTGTVDEIVHLLLAGVVRRTREHMPWRPGARALLTELAQAQVPSALVTMSWAPLAEVLVEHLPEGTFTAVVTGDQVTRGKPHPDPYLEAAARLGVAPEQCIAVEDSPTGAASATAAGVPTLVVPHTVAVPQMTGARQLDSLAGVSAMDLVRLATGHLTVRG